MKQAGAVKVKPLVWQQQSHDCHVAHTVFGDTAVQNESHALAPNRWGWWMAGSDEDDSPSGYAVTIEAAKAAAQADYEARILAALDTQPAPDPQEIDLRSVMMGEIEKAAQESPWVPAEYTMNEVISDCCEFLRKKPAPGVAALVDALRAIATTSNYTRASWMQETARAALEGREANHA